MEGKVLETRNMMFLFMAFIVKAAYASKECPDLVADPDMALSETVGWVGDEPVTVSCKEGYVLDTLVLQKNISCIDGPNSAIWSESLGSCQKKLCPGVMTQIWANMVVANQTNASFYYGDNVTVECEEGRAFHVDLTEPVDKVTTQTTMYCGNGINTTLGTWSSPGECHLISCDTPPDVDGSVMVYNATSFNSTVVYQCLSGYASGMNKFQLSATCNGSARWSTDLVSGTDLETKNCAKMRKYVGCLQNGSIIPLITTEDMNNGIIFCISFCKSQDKRFSAISNATCYCGNELVEGYSKVDDSACSLLCPGYDGVDAFQPVFCGGSSGEIAVYVTMDGCYKSVALTTEPFELVTEHTEITCRERCRGKDFSHAALQNDNVCFCLNSTSVSAVEVDINKCSNTSFFNTTHIYDLARSSGLRKSCNELFANGVRMNGDYYLEEHDDKQTCYFKDGTICDDGWIGFNSYCYHFNNETTMYFQDARNYCISLDADLVSIISEEEFTFLKDARTTYTDLWGDTGESFWWLGMVDIHNASLYMWLDGSIGTYSDFSSTPRDLTEHLAGDSSSNGYKWYELEDKEAYNVMCKKPREGPHCATIPAISPDYSLSNNDNTITKCVQICKGQQLTYAVIQNNTCNCVNTLPAYNAVAKTACDTECPGNRFQYCGGDFNTSSVLNVSEKLAARSCEELQLVGIDNNTFLLQTNDTVAQFQRCEVTECPFSWIYINGHCYKYMVYSKKIEEAIAMCAAEDAYLVTIETETEIEDVITAANNISLYSSIHSWRIGLLALSMNGGLYRWANGRAIELDYWNNSAIGLGGTVVSVLASDYRTWKAQSASSDTTPFICEKGADYKGCYSTSGMALDVSLHGYYSMTIQQCIEFCRRNNRKYSYLNSTSCSCETDLTSEQPGLCTDVCSGQDNQICGGLNVLSVYDVDEFPQFARNCTDLFLAGIFLSGTYLISGSEQVCNFTDGTVCSGAGWIGIEGNCYRHFSRGHESRDITCRNHNAVQTSLTLFTEYETIVQYVRRLNFHGSAHRVFTGITHGGYDLDVFISEDGFLTDYNLLTNDHLSVVDLHDDFGYISIRIDHTHTHHDGGVVCKEDKYAIGCFEVPYSLVSVLENFGSVELGLCRQMCISRNENITLIGHDFCACASESALSSFTSIAGERCDVHCKLHKNQLCGNGSSMWAYYSGIEDFPYAESCFHLYKSGIFYNSTYRLKSVNETVPFAESQCGFADETACPANWLGSSGMCYIFEKDHLSFPDALQYCAKLDAYLFNPVDNNSVKFVNSFINTSGLLSDNEWWIGIAPVFYNTSFLSSNGLLVTVDYSSLSNEKRPVNHTVFLSNTLTWRGRYSSNVKRASVCQTDKDFLGCHHISSVPDLSYGEFAGNTITQCIFWCKGQGHSYAATFARDCLCFKDYPSMSSAHGKCDIVCDGGTSQICGGLSAHDTVYHSVFNLTELDGVTGSCQDLFKQGIFKPGQYVMRFNVLTPYVKISCFQNPEPLHHTHADIKTLSASSVLNGHLHENLNLTYPFTNAWKPSKNEVGEFVKIVLKHEYLITGIVISGLQTHSEQSYLKSYSIQYRDLLLGLLETYSYNGSIEISSGCKENNLLCFHYFTEPIITNEIRIFPQSWHNSISLQIAIAGQPYIDFNHSKTFIGCAADPNLTFTNVSAATDIDECIIMCHNSLVPFASFDDDGSCFCGKGDFDYGFVEDSYCPINTTGFNHTGIGPYRALHRTFCNYVYKDYRPTVLNHHWTNVIVDSHVVDLVIWDLSGSDDYSDLRPLCYPQVDAFLVCFSLKSPDSFEHVQLKWIPEIEEHVDEVPVILVGCKRDKHCEPPDPDAVLHGNITYIEPVPGSLGLFTYNTTLTYTCNTGYELQDQTKEQKSFCLQSNQWSSLSQNCSIVSCPHFTVSGGAVNFTSLEYGGSATVTCHHGYWANNNKEQVTVYCNYDKQWSQIPTCTVDNLRHKQRHFSISTDTVREPSAMLNEVHVRSRLDCAAKCTEHYYCKAANFKTNDNGKNGGTCRLFLEESEIGALSNGTDWNYLEVEP